MWRIEREPIERLKEGVVGVVLTVGAARGPSLTTDSTLSFPSGTPSLSSFLAVASFLFLVGKRRFCIGADTRDIPLKSILVRCPLTDRSMNPQLLPLFRVAAEPRGEPAVLVLLCDALCKQRQRRRGPRGGSGVGSSFGFAPCSRISPSESARHHPLFLRSSQPSWNRCVAFAFGIPRFLGTRSRTLGAIFPASFPWFARPGVKWLLLLRFPLGLFLCATLP